MAGKPRTGKSKAARSRNSRSQTAPAVKTTVTAQASIVPDAAAARTPMVPRRRGVPVITDLKAATAERYPYVLPELRLVGILSTIVVVILVILYFTLS